MRLPKRRASGRGETGGVAQHSKQGELGRAGLGWIRRAGCLAVMAGFGRCLSGAPISADQQPVLSGRRQAGDLKKLRCLRHLLPSSLWPSNRPSN